MTKERKPALTTEQINEVKLMAKSMKVKQIAEHFGKAQSCIYAALATPEGYVRLKNPNIIYSDQLKSEMIEKARNETHTRLEITQEYGISFSLLSVILKRAGVKSTSINANKGLKKVKPTSRYRNIENRFSGIPDMWI